MGDPLSVTASIIAVLQSTSEVIDFCLDLANSPKAILSLKEEVESAYELHNKVFENLSPRSLTSIYAVVHHCPYCLSRLHTVVAAFPHL